MGHSCSDLFKNRSSDGQGDNSRSSAVEQRSQVDHAARPPENRGVPPSISLEELRRGGGVSTANQRENLRSSTIEQGSSSRPIAEFQALRQGIIENWQDRIRARIIANDVPTEQELNMNMYVEELEPQVRDAVLDLNRKGYSTHSSGFRGHPNADIQQIDGFFTLDNDTQRNLNKIGVEVISKNIKPDESGTWREHTSIRFRSKEPNLNAMKEKWAEITALIPDRGRSATPNIWGKRFREEYENTGKVRLGIPDWVLDQTY